MARQFALYASVTYCFIDLLFRYIINDYLFLDPRFPGGYEDDVDNGETFTYTGAGGRDLSGNKRTAEQSCDQTLDKSNLAIAVNCATKVGGNRWINECHEIHLL